MVGSKQGGAGARVAVLAGVGGLVGWWVGVWATLSGVLGKIGWKQPARGDAVLPDGQAACSPATHSLQEPPICATDPAFDAIVVSEETVPGAHAINKVGCLHPCTCCLTEPALLSWCFVQPCRVGLQQQGGAAWVHAG